MLPLPYEASLLDIVRNLDGFEIADRFEIGPTIFAVAPWTPASAAVVLAEDVVGGVAPSRPECAYVLEVEIAKEVLEVWSSWRGGATPTPEEAALAVLHYATHDAYQPTD